jgi:L-fuconolactonase
LIIDSHCHVGAVWYEPAETLLFQMDRCGVDRAVLVQMLGQFDNAYQQSCASRWPDRFASVVAVDPARLDAIATLRRLAAEGARGVRLRPTARSPGDDALAIWREAATLGLTISCVGTTAQFTALDFADLLTEVPQVHVALEHLGGIARPDADESAERVWDLARFPNLALKVPSLGQLSKRRAVLPAEGSPFEPGGDSTLRRAVLAFSPARLMWGSDFPVVSTREGYAESLAGPRAHLHFLDDVERSEIFGGTAARWFEKTT